MPKVAVAAGPANSARAAITINTVQADPTNTDTNIADGPFSEAPKPSCRPATTPSRRHRPPRRPEARFVTGTSSNVDGGFAV